MSARSKRYRSLGAALHGRDCGELWAAHVEIAKEGTGKRAAWRFKIFDRRGDVRLDVKLTDAIALLLASRGFRRVTWDGLEVGR